MPNRTYGTFGFNPFKTWLVGVAVSAISYGSYLLQVWAQGRGGVLVAALLGGAYSSTLTTVVLAKRAREQSRPHLYSGAMLAAAALLGGWLWMRRLDSGGTNLEQTLQPKNPLELGAAFLFAGLFVGMLFITHLALLYLGRAGLYALAAIMGVTDVDPFILSLAESASVLTPVTLAGGAIVIAAASNNLIKGVYAYGFGDRRTGTQGLALLTVLGLRIIAPVPVTESRSARWSWEKKTL